MKKKERNSKKDNRHRGHTRRKYNVARRRITHPENGTFGTRNKNVTQDVAVERSKVEYMYTRFLSFRRERLTDKFQDFTSLCKYVSFFFPSTMRERKEKSEHTRPRIQIINQSMHGDVPFVCWTFFPRDRLTGSFLFFFLLFNVCW